MTKRIFYPLALLVLPLIGTLLSDDVNWSYADFFLMGAGLLAVGMGIDLIRRRTENPKKRLLLIAGLIGLFLLVWVELAVGLFGSPIAGH